MNTSFFRTRALKGIGVSSNKLNSPQKGKILELTEEQSTHYLDYDEFRQGKKREQVDIRMIKKSFSF